MILNASFHTNTDATLKGRVISVLEPDRFYLSLSIPLLESFGGNISSLFPVILHWRPCSSRIFNLTSSNMPNLLVYGEKCPLCDIHFFSSLFCFCFCLCLHLNWIILSTFFLPVRISFNRFVSYLTIMFE